MGRALLLGIFLCSLSLIQAQSLKIDSLQNELIRNIDRNQTEKMATIYEELVNIFYDLRKADSVIKYAQLSLVYSTNENQKFELYDELSNIYYIKRDLVSAITYLDSCKLTNEKLKLLGVNKEASLLFRLGKIQTITGSYTDAERNLLEALNLFSKKDINSIDVASTHRQVARLYKLMKRRDEALHHFEKSLELYNKLGREETAVSLLNDLSGLYIRKKNYEKAFYYANRSLEMSQSLQTVKSIDVTYSRLGRLYYLMKRKDFHLSYKYLKLAEQYRRKDELENLMHSERYWFNHYQLQKKTDSATIHFNRYLGLNDSLNTQKRTEQISKFQVDLNIEKREKENLQLKSDKAEQELLTQKANKLKWIFGMGLLAITLVSFVIWRKYKAETKAKNIISHQKDKIEKQKNLVEILQKEIHHRLKNNLSYIDAFINLAKAKFPDQAYQEKLNELQNRIASMFEVHKCLFNKENITLVNAKKFSTKLVENITKTIVQPNVEIDYEIDGVITLPAGTSIPIGLIINEFVTNSYKYAFDGISDGLITISLQVDEENYNLRLSDNGNGLPKDFNLANLESFGIDIIQLLTEEYEGTFNLKGYNGVTMNITLPKLAA